MNTGNIAQHTPGPWRANERRSLVPERFFVDHVADPTKGIRVLIAENLSEANARLIAAAPDLLAALEDILGHPKGAECNVIGSCGVCKRARAAIAKARGA